MPIHAYTPTTSVLRRSTHSQLGAGVSFSVYVLAASGSTHPPASQR